MPATTKTYRGKLPRPTTRGDVRPEVAGKQFTVGNTRDTNTAQMELRLAVIREIYDRHCVSYWPTWLIPYLNEFARTGKVVWNPPATKHDGEAEAAINLRHYGLLQYYGLSMEVKDQDYVKIDKGIVELQQLVDGTVQKAIAEALQPFVHLQPFVKEQISLEPHGKDHRSFYEAVEAFKASMRKTGKKKDNGKLSGSPSNYIKWIDKVKAETVDFPLMRLDFNKMDELTAYWRNREYRFTIKGVESAPSKNYATKMLLGLWRFLNWLDTSDWNWTLPNGASKISRKIEPLDVDRKKRQARRINGTVYNPEQLAKIATRLDTFGKMVLGLSVNCAMQPAEVGRVEVGDYFAVHPDTRKAGDFIIFDRPKTHEYGEWFLWPEVAELVKWGIERSNRIGCDRLLVTDTGKDWYNDESSQAATRLSKWWQAIPGKNAKHVGIVTRMHKEDPTFPRYVISSLRKLLPSVIRPRWGKEMADIVNARKIDDDGLWRGSITDRYSDRPYDALADVLTELKDEFTPFLEALRIDP